MALRLLATTYATFGAFYSVTIAIFLFEGSVDGMTLHCRLPFVGSMRCPFLLRLGIQIKFSPRSLSLSFVFMPHSDFLNSAPSIQRAFLQGGRKIVIQKVGFSCSLLVFLTGRVILTQFALPRLFLTTRSFPTDEPFVHSSVRPGWPCGPYIYI